MAGATHHRPAFVHTSTSYNDPPAHMTASSSTSSAASSSSGSVSIPEDIPLPYSDYPPEKSEAPTPQPEYRQQNNPARGLYGYRRSPVTLSTPESGRIWTWFGSRLCKEGGNGGRLGKALIAGWVVTTLMFVMATAFWKGELFTALDKLSTDLREMGYQGQAIFGLLIFLTTIPPLPLYSTLMVLSGYTFGATGGFMISYIASLVGAVLVFVGSRTLLRDSITKCLASSPTSMTLLQIIPSRPDLLLLIRIAPYPYNLLNVVLASAQNLTLKTYTACTALSLLKVILHTWFGSGIHDLSELHARPPPAPPMPHGHPGPWHDEDSGGAGGAGGAGGSGGHHHHHWHQPPPDPRETVKFYGTWGGIVLCLFLFVYLHHIAKRALARAQAEAERDERVEEGSAGQGMVDVRTTS